MGLRVNQHALAVRAAEENRSHEKTAVASFVLKLKISDEDGHPADVVVAA